MLDIASLATYIFVVLGLMLIPGPAVLLTIERSVSGGKRAGIATGLGIATGDLVHTITATLGLSAVLATSALAFNVVKYVGAAYLIYIGIRAIWTRADNRDLPNGPEIDAHAFRRGMFAEILNPKTAMFFLAFLPQFAHPERGSTMIQFALLGGIFVVLSAAYTSTIAVGAGWIARRLRRHRSVGRWRGHAIGAVYVGLGVRVALQQR